MQCKKNELNELCAIQLHRYWYTWMQEGNYDVNHWLKVHAMEQKWKSRTAQPF